MIKSIRIKNFRALEDFIVDPLGRVNLIVGKNNSGKSSVLEALRIYAGNAQRDLLEQIATEHDEKTWIRETDLDQLDATLPFEDFFSGRRYFADDKIGIEIGEVSSEQSLLSIQHGFYIELREKVDGESGEPAFRIRRKRVTAADIDSIEDERSNHALFIQKGDRSTMLRLDTSNRMLRGVTADLPGTMPCSIIPTKFVSIDELADEWDKIGLTEHQHVVKAALQIISDDFEDIIFVRRDDTTNSARRSFSRTAKVKLSKNDRPVPLNSLGDGMLRVLQLALKLFPARGGMLLIDEFENGLHYSVQEKVWQLIFEQANKLDIQVFATTHSWDCVESFARVAEARQDVDGVLFRVGRSVRTSDHGRVIATVFDKRQLFAISQADVEVR